MNVPWFFVLHIIAVGYLQGLPLSQLIEYVLRCWLWLLFSGCLEKWNIFFISSEVVPFYKLRKLLPSVPTLVAWAAWEISRQNQIWALDLILPAAQTSELDYFITSRQSTRLDSLTHATAHHRFWTGWLRFHTSPCVFVEFMARMKEKMRIHLPVREIVKDCHGWSHMQRTVAFWNRSTIP